MTDRTMLGRNLHATQAQRQPRGQAMRVVPDTYASGERSSILPIYRAHTGENTSVGL